MHEGRISNYFYFYGVQCCYDNWCFMNCINKSLDSFRTHVGIIYIPYPRFAIYLSLWNLSAIVTGLLAIDLILCVKMRERILIGPHKKESERKGNLEYILRGWVYKKRWHRQKRDSIEEEMKEKERDITSDQAQESKFPWSVISFLLLVTKSSLHPLFFHIAS